MVIVTTGHMAGITAGLWGFTTLGMYPPSKLRLRGRTADCHQKGPKSMDSNTKE